MRRLLRFALVLSALGAVLGASSVASATASATAPTYSVTVVGPFSQQYRFGLGLNNRGHVTGQTAGAQAFFYDGLLHLLGKPPGARFSVGQGISDTDIVAATAQLGSVRHAYAVTYANGHATWNQLAGLPGYGESEAEDILPDGAAITGELCATADPACSHLGEHSQAAVWWRSGQTWSAPVALPASKLPSLSHASGIARAGAITVVSGAIVPRGSDAPGTAVLWLLPGHRYFRLKGKGPYSGTRADAIAHGSGNTFYVAGSIWKPPLATYAEPAMWTVTCSRVACRQTKLQVITSIGETYAVNSHGVVTGYDRVEGAGFNFVWQGGVEIPLPSAIGGINPFGINNSGQIAGWRANQHNQVILLTPTTNAPRGLNKAGMSASQAIERLW